MRKYLVIGSAPYIRTWFSEYGERMINAGFKLCPINNAWAIAPDHIHIWFHSTDFKHVGHIIPAHKDIQKWDIKETRDEDYTPYTYNKKGSGTMILNVLCDLLNRTVSAGERCIVAIAGSDCVYDRLGRDHFYEGGTPDPVRYGDKWLISELCRIGAYYTQERCVIVNVGGQKRTLLPFTTQNVECIV